MNDGVKKPALPAKFKRTRGLECCEVLCRDDGTTDMFDILLPTDESQEVTIHTLSGLQITRTTQRDFDAVWQQLPKGVYIINGKKWIK